MSDYEYKVPRTMRDKYDAIIDLTDAVCDEHLNDGYADLAREMTAVLSRKRPSPLDLKPFDPDWTLPSTMDENPMAQMIQANGMLVDAREMPQEIQEEAYRKDLIPYVPS